MDNNFLDKFKEYIKKSYESGGEVLGDAYNKTGDWAELLADKLKSEGKDINKSLGMEELSPEMKDLAEQAAFSSPSMGITRAVKELGPVIGKQINKMKPTIVETTGWNSGEGLYKYAKDDLADYKKRYPETVDKVLSNWKKVVELSKEGRFGMGADKASKISEEMDTYLTRHGGEIIPELIATAARGIKNPVRSPTAIFTNTEDLGVLNMMLEHYTRTGNTVLAEKIYNEIMRIKSK
jgi:hypothetical protein